MDPSWTKCFSKTYQRDYWFNASTGEKRWDPPNADFKSEAASSPSLKRPHSDSNVPPLKTKRSADRVAIIVPFQDTHKEQKRKAHLDQFIPYMKAFLGKGSAEFQVFVIEQNADDKKFNRGILLNIGFDLANKDGYSIFVFHDVDLLPSEDLLEYYTQRPSSPMHIARVWNRYNSNDKYFGGIVAFSDEDFRLINGFPNDFWGWGGEDDALIKRVHEMKLSIHFPKKGQLTDLEEMDLKQKLDFLREHKDWKCADKWERLEENSRSWRENGLSNLKYKVLDTERLADHAVKFTVGLD